MIHSHSNTLLEKGLDAWREGRKGIARRLAIEALRENPENDQAWLLLSATASPRASLFYLKRAIEINPDNSQAKKALQWALARLDSQPVVNYSDTQPVRVRKPQRTKLWQVALIILVSGFSLTCATTLLTQSVLRSNRFQSAWITAAQTWFPSTATAQDLLALSTQPNITLEPTGAYTQSMTSIPSNTPVPVTAAVSQPVITASSEYPIPAEPTAVADPLEQAKFWIEVDLSAQRLRAYQGNQLLNAFIISGGKKQTPTVTGTYRIYVKYRFADMKGPGYLLENVPYVMYFYESYGVHGTYWHNNFGTPMSHGCINLSTEDAAWLYRQSKIGTMIQIHR